VNLAASQPAPPATGAAPAGRLLDIDAATFQKDFGRAPFLIRHHLADHPLFGLPRLVELAQALPGHRVEYNAGDVAVSQDPTATPRTGLSVAETIRRIEECRSWMVLKNVELDPAYRDLLDACLAEVLGIDHPYTRGVGLREAFIFVSSAGAVTPYHMDPELNFLLQIRGGKQMHVFPGDDRAILSEPELERFHAGAHRNMVFRDEYQQKARTFELRPGDGLHVPVAHPHWVKVGPEGYSISFSITFLTRLVERQAVLYQLNHAARQKGGTPVPPGQSPWRDNLRYATHRLGRRVRRLLGGKDDPAGPAY
jgi:hypothetical protein